MTANIYRHLPLEVGVPVADRNVPSPGDRAAAGRRQEIISTNSNSEDRRVEAEIVDEMFDALPDNTDDGLPFELPNLNLFRPDGQYLQRAKAAFSAIEAERQIHPDAYRDLPSSFEELQAESRRRRDEEYAEAQRVLEAAPPGFDWFSFAGAASGALTDELTISTLGAGAAANAGIRTTIAVEAGIGAADAARTVPQQIEVAEELPSVPEPNPVLDIALGAALGGAVGGVAAGVGRVLSPRADGTRPADVDPVDHVVRQSDAAADLDAARPTVVRGDRTPDPSRPVSRVEIDFEMGPRRPNRPDPPVLDVIGRAVEDVLGPDARVVVTSGRELPGTRHGSRRHGTGDAADIKIFTADGRQISIAEDPEAMRDIARAAARRGAKGIGFGQGYMGGSHMHIDLVEPDPARNEANTWGIEGTAMRGELVGIMNGAPALDRSAGRIDDSALVDAIVGVESSGNPAAANPRSTATGLGQFVEATWLEMIRRYRPDIAKDRTPNQILALRTDPSLSREMTLQLTRDNRSALREAGLTDGPAETYLAHFAGQTGAIQVLRAPPDRPIKEILSAGAISANRSIRHRGVSFANMNAGQLRMWAASKMQGRGLSAATPTRPISTSRGYTRTGQTTAGDFTVDVEYEVVDARTLRPASGDLQPRDRSRASSAEQINEIASRLDPARLLPSPEADRGAPIVGPDDVIESGNGRVAGLRRAAEIAPDRRAAYRTAIEDAGFPVPEGVEEPILIARRRSDLTDGERQAFVRAANTSAVARMSPAERSAMDARAVSPAALARYRPDAKLTSAENAPFVRSVLDGLPQAERSGLVTADGRVNAEGAARIREAMFARAFDADDIRAAALELESPEIAGLVEALQDVAPEWAQLRAAIEAGDVRPEMDISGHVQEAMRLIASARETAKREGGKVADLIEEMIGDIDLIDGALAPLSAALVRKMAPAGRVARSDRIASFLRRYAAEALQVGQAGDALLDAPGPLDVLKRIDGDAFGDLTELGQPRGNGPAAPTSVDPAGDAPAFVAGADASATRAASDQMRRTLRAEDPDRLQAEPIAPADADLVLDAWKQGQPADTLDDMMALAAQAHGRLVEAVDQIEADLGVKAVRTPLKDPERVTQKVQDKKYDSIRQVTDISRAGFLVGSNAEADAVFRALARNFDVLDEGWTRNALGYIDKKIMVRHENGMISEIQVWSPEMYEAKAGRGTELYNELRQIPSDGDSARRAELIRQSETVYSAAARADGWLDAAIASSTSKRLNRSANAPGSITDPVSRTSVASTSTQSSPGRSLATADALSVESNAGRPSQAMSLRDMNGSSAEGDAFNVSGPDASRKGQAEIRADLAARAASPDPDEIDVGNGVTMTPNQVLDDMDQTDALDSVAEACPTGRGL